MMKKLHKTTIIILSTICLLMLNPTKLSATHVAGSDISYACLGKKKYKITFNIYRYCGCSSAGLGATASVIISPAAGGCSSITLSASRVSIIDVTPVCLTAAGICSGGCGKGIEEHKYEIIVNLDSAPYKTWAASGCCQINFTYNLCCRNSNITTGLNDRNFFSYAMLDICNLAKTKDSLCNNSPKLTNPPVAFACCNQPYTYNSGASDEDLDSLSYALVCPLGSMTNDLVPTSPLDCINPLGSYCPPSSPNPCTPVPTADPPIGFFIDKINGDIIFTPVTCGEIGVLAVQVNEFRKDTNGVMRLIGVIRRDIQMWVETCGNNNPPQVLGPYSASVCEGDNICMDIKSKDDPVIVPPPGISQTPDTTTLTWNKGIVGASFSIINPTARLRTARVCWTPKIGQASTLPYNFTITAKDQACPRPAITIRGYSIIVKKRAQAARKYDTFPCGKLRYEAILPTDFEGLPRYIWTIKTLDQTQIINTSSKQKDSFRFRKGGTYIMELLINNTASCPSLYLDTIIIPKFIEVELAVKDTFVCEFDSISLIPRIGYGTRPIIFDWRYASTNQQISTDSIIKLKPTRDTIIAIKVTDANTCVNVDTVKIHWQQLVRQNLGPDRRVCTYQDVVLTVPSDSTLRYVWNSNDLLTDTFLRINIAGNNWVHAFDSLGCSAKDTMQLFVNDTVTANAGPDGVICLRDVYDLKGQKLNNPLFIHTWRWFDLRQNMQVGTLQDIKVSPLDSTNYRLHLTITQSGQSCESADTMFLRVNQLPNTTVSNPQAKCFDEGQFNLLAASPVGTGYTWSQSGNSDIWFQMQDKDRDTMIRKGISAPHWYYTQRFFTAAMNNGKVPPEPNPSDNIFIHVRHRPTGCKDSALFRVTINPNPFVRLRNRTLCQDGGAIKVNSNISAPTNLTSGRYTWRIDSAPPILTNADLAAILVNESTSFFDDDYVFYPRHPNPMIALDDPINTARLGRYKLRFCFRIGSTNCQTCDSMYILVDTLPKIEFTPFPLICYSDSIINLDQFVNLPQGRWELKSFNSFESGAAYNTARARMIDSTQINIKNLPGTYFWRYLNMMTGCPVADSIIMNVNPRPNLRVTELDTICINSGTINLIPLSNRTVVEGRAGSEWTGAGVINNIFDPTAVAVPNTINAFYGPYKMYVKWIEPITTCINTDSIDVLIQAPPLVTITTPLPAEACEGIPFNLTATSERVPAGFIWTTAGDGIYSSNTVLNPVYTPGINDRTNYGTVLTLTSNQPGYMRNCPISTKNLKIDIHAYPIFTFGDFDSGCAPLNVDFFSDVTRPTNFPVTYDWDFGNGVTSSDANPAGILYDKHGKYEVKLSVKNTAGSCETRDSAFFVDVFPVPVASMVSNPDFYTTIALPQFQFTSTSTVATGNLVRYEWNFGTGNPEDTSAVMNPVFKYNDDTAEYNISLRVTSDKGCIDDTIKYIKIGPDITVFIPSAFSPDGAGPGRNNKFYVVAQGYIGYNMQIFNRWGERLFESHHPENEPWDGTYKGEPVQMDVYMYYAKVIAFDGKEYEYSGTVSLIK